mmetsp:Transcript_83786/g.233694  ORF Transcript_83786/g.233694 Transcript_83786/m.233694 type:complete len:268 (-) Transcript_83786:140-943(-)
MVDCGYPIVDAIKMKAATRLQSNHVNWWRLVWCHERCHKPENEARRQAMGNEIVQLGAGLVCMKKAKQFGLWIEREPRPVYVLVTDWREAQPCMHAVSQHSNNNRPIFTIVICDSERQQSRAAEWAKHLPADVGMVQVHERSHIPGALLGGFLRKFFGRQIDLALPAKVDPTPLYALERALAGITILDDTEDSTTEQNEEVKPPSCLDLPPTILCSQNVFRNANDQDGHIGVDRTYTPASHYNVCTSLWRQPCVTMSHIVEQPRWGI